MENNNVYSYISVKELIAKFVRDLNVTNLDALLYSSLIEWIAEAELMIGSKRYFKTNTVSLAINNGESVLPCDFYEILRLTYNGYPLTYDSSIVKSGHSIPMSYYISDDKILHGIHDDGGNLSLTYYGFIVDCDGYPMIVNTIEHKDAVFKYCVYKYKYPDYIMGRLPENVYRSLERDWFVAKRKARAYDYMPTFDEFNQIKKYWLRLVPDVNSWVSKDGMSSRTANSNFNNFDKLIYGR